MREKRKVNIPESKPCLTTKASARQIFYKLAWAWLTFWVIWTAI